MDSLEPYRILILSNQVPTINRILGTLRNEGIDLNAQVATNKTELKNKFKSQKWDLVLCCEESPVAIDIVEETIKNQCLELPTILLTEIESSLQPEELYRIGVNDYLPIQDKNKIVSAIKREVNFQRLKMRYGLLQLDFKELEKRHEAIMDASNSPLAYIQEGMHLYCNESYAQLFSNSGLYDVKQSLFLDLFTGENRERLKNTLSKKFDSERKLTLTLNTKKKSGLLYNSNLVLSFTPVSFNGQSCLQLMVKPVIGNPEYFDQVNAVNNQDLLTQLYNKNFFYEKIELAIRKAIKQQQQSSLLIVQLNEFLDIKSAIGLSNANQVLSDVAAFLRKSIQKQFSAARIDDYQFGLLIENCKLAESIELANFIKSKINNHITTAALPNMQLSCSIGVAVVNESAFDAKDLVAKAQVSLHKTLSDIASPQIQNAQSPDLDALTTYINLALEQKRIKLLFQPIVALKKTYSQDYVVLSRIIDDAGKDMQPAEYLPVTNLTGLGEEFDKVVVNLALTGLEKVANNNIRLVINLTSNTFLSKTFLPWLSETLQLNIINSERLLFQISETQICNNLEYCSKFSHGLRELGFACVVSDYGCAAQAENYLDDIQPVYVKLDKSLIQDIGYSNYQYKELKSLIIDLHDKQFKIAVPQVEDAAMLSLLCKLDTDFVQGYYLERPLQDMNYKFIQHYTITADALMPG